MTASVALVALPSPVTAAGDGPDGGHGRGDEHVSPQTIATGLNAAWGIDAGPLLGSVLVAESGSGDVLKLWDGGHHVVASPGAGVVNVATDGWGASYVIGQAEEGPSNVLGRVGFDGSVTVDADFGAFEAANNPDQGATYGIVDPPPGCAVPPEAAPYTGIVDSNVYGLEVLGNGYRLVADAAGNDVLLVDPAGNISVVAVLPPVPKTLPAELPSDEGTMSVPDCLIGATYLAEPVPTGVVKGPDGYLYVTGLTGAPELPGTGVVFRVNPWTGQSEIWLDGLTFAGDLEFDSHGRLYVIEIFGGTGPQSETPGALVRVDTTWTHDGLRPTGVTTVATGADGVVTPLGVAVDAHDDVYVTVKGLPLGPPAGDAPPPAIGEVLRFPGSSGW